jgi:hypothetical protein
VTTYSTAPHAHVACACGAPIVIKKSGECRRCYDQRRQSTADRPRRERQHAPSTTHVRLWALVTPHGIGGCWLWIGATNPGGYGLIWDSTERRMRVVHRVTWEERHGPLPAGLRLDHTCTNRACVNPDHLDPVTTVENNRRARERQRLGEYRSHCSAGHALTPENTRTGRDGRRCRICLTASDRARRAGRTTCPECGDSLAKSSIRQHAQRRHPHSTRHPEGA